jgi:hypothetical protein
VAVVAVSPVVVAPVPPVARPDEIALAQPDEAAPVATHQVVVRVDIEVEAEVEALGHQVRGLLEMQYSEVPHLLTSASRPPVLYSKHSRQFRLTPPARPVPVSGR